MKILVTGGKGYIGSALVPHLEADGHEVEVYDKPKDIRDTPLLQQAMHGKDAVVHLAATFDSAESMIVNYLATSWVVFIADHEHIKRLIFTSTCGALNKDDQTEYTKWKRSAEPTMRRYGYTVLRLASVYGLSPVMNYAPLVNMMVKDARETGVIKLFGHSEYRPLVHIDDAVQAIGLLLGASREKAEGRNFNLATQNCTKRWIANQIQRNWPKTEIQTLAGHGEGYRVDLSPELIELGFTPTKLAVEGIREMTC